MTRVWVNWFWNSKQFAQLFEYNKKDAYLYAKSCWVDMKESMEDYKPEWDLEKCEWFTEKEDKGKEEKNVTVMSLKEKKALLKKNWVKFHVNLWESKINWLLIENELI